MQANVSDRIEQDDDIECEAIMSIKLELPEITDLKPRIAVVGVGGAGGNAINNMIDSGLDGVEFITANTDAQALGLSNAERRIQLGVNLTEGLGAGSRPEIGHAAAEEAINELRSHLAGAHMVFIAAGMGGGTGTGAASVVARVAREENALTVGVVTKPFLFEGSRRMRVAEAGIEELKEQVDTLIIIPNQNLFRIASKNTTFSEAFLLADKVLHSGIACITDLIVREGLINLDFADVKVVMSNMGSAMMGMGEAGGENRAVKAAEEAIANPLLDGVTVRGARGLVISIAGGKDLTLYEVDEAASRIRQEVDPDAHMIVGATFDDELQDRIRVSILASGLVPQNDGGVVGSDLRSTQAPVNSGPGTGVMPHGTRIPEPQPQSQGRETAKPVQQTIANQPADSLKKKLSDAIRGGKSVPVQLKPSQAVDDKTTKRTEEVWKAPGNVTIVAGPPELASRQMPSGNSQQTPTAKQNEFRPAAPSSVRSEPRRMPTLDDFPVVGHREFESQDEKSQALEKSDTITAKHTIPAKKKGFFGRLKSAAKVGKTNLPPEELIASPSHENQQPRPEEQSPAHSAVPITSAETEKIVKRAGPGKDSSPVEGGEDIDFPMIFQDRAKNG